MDVGVLNHFGFRIAPATDERQLREVSIFIGGNDLTHRDNTAYLPSFLGQLAATSDALKRKIDYLKHEDLFRGMNVTQIHNLLLHGNADVFADEDEWWAVAAAHRFADWGETTNGFTAFLIPYFDRLYLTSQSRDYALPEYEMLEVIDCVETTPYYLIATMDDAKSILKDESDSPRH